jgi:hypothetical protein
MRFYDHLFSLTQRTHALMSHFALLCKDDTKPGDHCHQGSRFHAASLHDFLRILRTEQAAMNTHLDALEREIDWAIALLEATGSPMTPHTYGMLSTLLENFAPYLNTYPELSPAEAYRLFLDNTWYQDTFAKVTSNLSCT